MRPIEFDAKRMSARQSHAITVARDSARVMRSLSPLWQNMLFRFPALRRKAILLATVQVVFIPQGLEFSTCQVPGIVDTIET